MQNGSLRLANTPAQSFLRNTIALFNVMPSGCSLSYADFPFVQSALPSEVMRAQQRFKVC
jgi:hypothetical protein